MSIVSLTTIERALRETQPTLSVFGDYDWSFEFSDGVAAFIHVHGHCERHDFMRSTIEKIKSSLQDKRSETSNLRSRPLSLLEINKSSATNAHNARSHAPQKPHLCAISI